LEVANRGTKIALEPIEQVRLRSVWSYVAEASETDEQVKARFRAEHPDQDPDSDDVLLIIRRLVAPRACRVSIANDPHANRISFEDRR
jgi:hypothetical protein